MKTLIISLTFASICFSTDAQELFRLQLDNCQYVESKDGAMGSYVKFPNGNATVVMGGLNDLDGMNNYFNLFGSKLIIDSLDKGSDGIQKVVLRREDGRDFFDFFPTISANLIPMIHPEIEDEDNEPLN